MKKRLFVNFQKLIKNLSIIYSSIRRLISLIGRKFAKNRFTIDAIDRLNIKNHSN